MKGDDVGQTPNSLDSGWCRRTENLPVNSFVTLVGSLLLAVVLVLSPARAQLSPNLSPDEVQDLIKNASPEQLRQLQQRGFPVSGGQAQSGQPSLSTVLTPADSRSGVRPESSVLENVLSDRAGHPLRLFGYDQVGVSGNVVVPQTGTVQDDYVLGPGDEIVVVLRGQENSQFSATVDRNGQIVLPKTGPVPAAGKTLANFRQDLIAAVQRAYVSTQAYISVGQLRQVTVMVAGEIANPGMRILTGLSNPLDAILLSGGVKKSGSLRDIRLIRRDQTILIDLYGILTKRNNARLINLQDGDRVFVPPIGSTVAIAGYVRRPAIYELPAGQDAVSANELLILGNGAVLRGSTTASILRIMPDGKGKFVDISGQLRVNVRDGEVMIVKSAVDISVGRVTLAGAVRTPGAFAVDRFKTLHQVLPSSDAFEPGAYILFGFIDRINKTTLQHEAIPFSPLHVMEGKEDVALATDDTIYVLTTADVHSLINAARGQIPEGSAQQSNAGGASRSGTAGTSLGVPSAATNVGNTAQQPARAENQGSGSNNNSGTLTDGSAPGQSTADATFNSVAAFAGGQFGNKLSDYRFSIGGAVQKPGTYLAAPNTSLAEVLTVLGGLTDDVDLSSFELTSIEIDNASGRSTTSRKSYPAAKDQLASILLRPYDQLKFRQVYSDRDQGSVSIEGQVHYPGNYSILRTEHLSSVLQRAGGLTEAAYPYGTVFLRQSVAQEQADSAKRVASDIRSQLFAVIMRPTSATTSAPPAETIVALQSLLTQIEGQPALGRVSFVADPDVLARFPERDPVLQPGDRIVIPKIPSSVSVLGEVMRPGAFPLDRSLSTSDYIEEAGGYTEFADSSRVIVVLPDGRARVQEKTWLSMGTEPLPPGSVIVVARDVTGISFHQLIVDTTQIISQFAVTAASLAVLTTNMK
jgi:polysaccharide biosynthesis/export protein